MRKFLINLQTTNQEMASKEPCKYGVNCYQKNPMHLQKYQHPPKRKLDDEAANSPAKRLNIEALAEKDDVQPMVVKETENTMKNVEETQVTEETASSSRNEEQPISAKTLDISALDKTDFIKWNFLFEMPDDFYAFFEFCKQLNPKDPCQAFKAADLTLVGPFDVLANKFENVSEKTPEEYLVHWRYYYDPPEFQTVIQGDNSTGFHLGYFRDDPKEKPVFMAGNESEKDGVFSIMGENIFAAVNLALEEALHKCDPFKKMQLNKLQVALKKKSSELHYNLAKQTEKIRKRNNKIVSRTFNKIGLVVPVDKKTDVGYRPLTFSNREVKALLDAFQEAETKDSIRSKLQPLYNNTCIATDEFDFGTGIELGWNIIAHGVEGLEAVAQNFLCISYNLLQRHEFAKIAQAHMKNRRKGTALSILENN